MQLISDKASSKYYRDDKKRDKLKRKLESYSDMEV